MKNININIGEDICIDPGTDFISIYIAGRGLVLREAAVVAYSLKKREVLEVGDDAGIMDGKTPETIGTIHPIQGGVIIDEEFAYALISRLIKKVKRKSLIKPRVMVSIPCGISNLEERAMVRVIMRAGAREVLAIESPVAAALGAGCDITIARGLMVLDIGAGKTEMAVVSMCHAVMHKTTKIAGEDFTNAVKSFIKRKYSLEIGTKAAREIKENISGFAGKIDKFKEIYGVDTTSHLPRKINISLPEAEEIFIELIESISDMIKDTLDNVPPEYLGDILEDGILLVGGGAKLYRLADKLSNNSGIKIFPADDIDLCNIKGAGIAMENLDALPDIAQSYHNM